MATAIYSQGVLLRIDKNGYTYLLRKSQVRSVEVIRNDTVRLEISESTYRNIYLYLDDVVHPVAIRDIYALRSLIHGMLQAQSDGTASELKQDEQIELLNKLELGVGQIRSLLTVMNEKLYLSRVEKPQLIDQSQPGVVYYGYSNGVQAEGDPVWSILREAEVNGTLQLLWADGDKFFDNSWSDRYQLNYQGLDTQK